VLLRINLIGTIDKIEKFYENITIPIDDNWNGQPCIDVKTFLWPLVNSDNIIDEINSDRFGFLPRKIDNKIQEYMSISGNENKPRCLGYGPLSHISYFYRSFSGLSEAIVDGITSDRQLLHNSINFKISPSTEIQSTMSIMYACASHNMSIDFSPSPGTMIIDLNKRDTLPTNWWKNGTDLMSGKKDFDKYMWTDYNSYWLFDAKRLLNNFSQDNFENTCFSSFSASPYNYKNDEKILPKIINDVFIVEKV